MSAIETDYQGNIPATDRFWYYDFSQDPPEGYQYPGIEYPNVTANPSAVGIDKVVYKRGNSVTIKTTFKNHTQDNVVASFYIENARIECPSGYNRPNPVTIQLTEPGAQVVSIPPTGTASVTFTVTGMPNYVALGEFKYESHLVGIVAPYVGIDLISAINGSPGPESIDIYVVDDQPLQLQSTPWTDVLNFACDFAFGKAGPDDVAKECTFGLYWSSVFAYNLGTLDVPARWYRRPDGMISGPLYFHLRDLLSKLQSLGTQPGNCVDVSIFLLTLFNSLGVDAQLQALMPTWETWFITNPVCPIGSDGTQSSLYVQIYFGFHNQTVRSSKTYDAALAFEENLAAQSHMNPSPGWDMPGYWQVILNGESYGLVYRLFFPGIDLLVPHWAYPFEVVQPSPNLGAFETEVQSPVFWNIPGYWYDNI